jgi:hypothetical protein
MENKKMIPLIIEKNEGELWGRIEGIGDFMPLTIGSSKDELVTSLKILISDYKANEGKADTSWRDIDTENIIFSFHFDVQSFFDEFNFLNQTKIAELAGINPALLRQYASGVKHPSKEQALKIEKAIHNLSRELQAVSVYAD